MHLYPIHYFVLTIHLGFLQYFLDWTKLLDFLDFLDYSKLLVVDLPILLDYLGLPGYPIHLGYPNRLVVVVADHPILLVHRCLLIDHPNRLAVAGHPILLDYCFQIVNQNYYSHHW